MVKPSSAKAKGRAFEKKVCLILKEAFQLDDDEIRTVPSSVQGCDIVFSKAARERVGMSVECKNVRKLSIWAALDQAKKNTIDSTVPALIFRRSSPGNRDIWICVPLTHYLEVRRAAQC